MKTSANVKTMAALLATATLGFVATPASAHQHRHHHARYAAMHRHHHDRMAGGYGGMYSGRSAYEGSVTPGYVIPAVDLAAAEHPGAAAGLGGGLPGGGLLGGGDLLGTGLLGGNGLLGLGILGL